MVGEAQGHVGVLFGQQEGNAFLFVQAFYDPEDLFDKLWGKAHGWFIQKDHGWFCHQGAANGDHLLLATGSVSCLRFATIFNAREIAVDHLQVIIDCGASVGACIRAGHQILFHG